MEHKNTMKELRLARRALGRWSQPQKAFGRGLRTQKHLEEHHQENTNAKKSWKTQRCKQIQPQHGKTWWWHLLAC